MPNSPTSKKNISRVLKNNYPSSCSIQLLFFLTLFLVLGVPIFALGSITSVQSGSWDDPETWGGIVPDTKASVVISAGHNLTIPTTGVTCSSLTSLSSPKKWARITGQGQLTITNGGAIHYVSFQNRGGIRIPLLQEKSTLVLEHCTFNDMKMLHLGTPSQTNIETNITLTDCDFRNVYGSGSETQYIVLIDGKQGQHSGYLRIKNNTFVGTDGSEGIRIQRRDGAIIEDNVFIDSCIHQLHKKTGHSSSGGHVISHNLFAHIHDNGRGASNRVIYVIPSEKPVQLIGNYIYDVHWNDHTITGGSSKGQNLITDNIFEYGPTTKEANAISMAAVPLLVENNILIGSATLISNVGNHTGSKQTTVRNNIMYNTGQVVPALFLSENGLPLYPLHFEKNIVVLGKYAFRHNEEPKKQAVIKYCDYNTFWQVTTPYHSSIKVSSGQLHETTDKKPHLHDPQRGFLSFYDWVEGNSSQNAEDVANKFASMNGYNPQTYQQLTISEILYRPHILREWVAQGFSNKVNQ